MMRRLRRMGKRNGFGEVVRRLISIGTITVGGWLVFDKFRDWLTALDFYDQYWWIIAIGLLYLGLVIIDLE